MNQDKIDDVTVKRIVTCDKQCERDGSIQSVWRENDVSLATNDGRCKTDSAC